MDRHPIDRMSDALDAAKSRADCERVAGQFAAEIEALKEPERLRARRIYIAALNRFPIGDPL